MGSSLKKLSRRRGKRGQPTNNDSFLEEQTNNETNNDDSYLQEQSKIAANSDSYFVERVNNLQERVVFLPTNELQMGSSSEHRPRGKDIAQIHFESNGQQTMGSGQAIRQQRESQLDQTNAVMSKQQESMTPSVFQNEQEEKNGYGSFVKRLSVITEHRVMKFTYVLGNDDEEIHEGKLEEPQLKKIVKKKTKQEEVMKDFVDAIIAEDLEKVVELFYTYHVNVNVFLKHGRSPLTEACKADASEAVGYLLQMGACMNKENKEGYRAIHAAASEDSVTCLRKIVHHVDSTVRDFRGDLFLTTDAFKHRGEPVALWLPHNHFRYEVNARDGWGRTATYYAAWNNRLNALHYLIDLQADLEIVDNDRRTPLFVAAMRGHTQMVVHLLYAIRTDSTHKKKMLKHNINSAIDIATERNHAGVVEMLKFFQPGNRVCELTLHERLLLHFTAYFLRKLEKEKDLLVCSRVYENKNFVEEWFEDDDMLEYDDILV